MHQDEGHYDRLTAEQVKAAYTLFIFLKRLRIIGNLVAHTEPAKALPNLDDPYELIDMTGHIHYALVKDGYESEKNSIQHIELLERMFGRVGTIMRGTT